MKREIFMIRFILGMFALIATVGIVEGTPSLTGSLISIVATGALGLSLIIWGLKAMANRGELA